MNRTVLLAETIVCTLPGLKSHVILAELDHINTINFGITGEKRKQKLALLNELLDPSNLPSITGHGHIDDVPGPSGSSDTSAPPAPLTNHLIPLDLNRFEGTGTYSVPQACGGFTQESIPTAISNQLAAEFLPVLDKGNPPKFGSHEQWEAVMPGLIQQSPMFTGQPLADSIGYRAIEEVLEDCPDSSHRGPQASSNDDSSLKEVLHGVEGLSIEQKRYLLRYLQQDTRELKSPASSQKMLRQTPGQLQAKPSDLPEHCSRQQMRGHRFSQRNTQRSRGYLVLYSQTATLSVWGV